MAAPPPNVVFMAADATSAPPQKEAPFFDCAATGEGNKSTPKAAAESAPAAAADATASPARRLAAEAEAALALSGLPAPLGAIAVRNPWDDLLHLSPEEAERAHQEARRLVARAMGGGDASNKTADPASLPASSQPQRDAALEVAIARADAALDADGECLAALWARARALLAHGAAHAAVVDLRRLTAALPPIPEQWPVGLDALLRDAHAASRPEGFVMREHMAAYAKGQAARAAIAEAVKARREALERRGGVKWPAPPAAGPSVLLHRGAGAALDAKGAAAALAAALGGVERPHLLALGLEEGATDQEVRAAFHAFARALHPDKQRAKGLPAGAGEGAATAGGKGGLPPPPPRGSARTFEEAQEAYEAIGRLRGGLGL